MVLSRASFFPLMCTMTMSKLLCREDTKGWRAVAKMGKISRVWLFFSVLKWNKVDFSCLDILKTGKRRSVGTIFEI